MLFALLIYGNESGGGAVPAAKGDECMARYRELEVAWLEKGGITAAARLESTASAVTVREKNHAPVVFDGPFAETKEQFLGLCMLQCQSLEEAIQAANMLKTEYHSIEVRPVAWAGGHSVES